MKTNLEKTTVKDISRFINASCLRADCDTSLEALAEMLCTSDRYKVYLSDKENRVCGVIQAKQIALEILSFSTCKDDAAEMIPATAFALNARQAMDLAERPVCVRLETTLGEVLDQMQCNSIREIAVVDYDGQLLGTLEAKNILQQYLQAKAEASF